MGSTNHLLHICCHVFGKTHLKLRVWETVRQTGGLAAETASWPGLQGNVDGNSFPSVASGQALAPWTALGASGRAVLR